MMRVIQRTVWEDARQWDAWRTYHDVNDTHGPTARLRTCYIDKNMPTYVYIDRYIHTHMHTHTYIQRTSRVATSVLSGRLVLAKVQADQKKRIITGSEYSSPPPSQTRFCRKATPLACKRNTLDKKTSLNISFGTGGSIICKLWDARSRLFVHLLGTGALWDSRFSLKCLFGELLVKFIKMYKTLANFSNF